MGSRALGGNHPQLKKEEWLRGKHEEVHAAILFFTGVEGVQGCVHQKCGRDVREMPQGWTDHGGG
jgi:hypothetical protein